MSIYGISPPNPVNSRAFSLQSSLQARTLPRYPATSHPLTNPQLPVGLSYRRVPRREPSFRRKQHHTVTHHLNQLAQCPSRSGTCRDAEAILQHHPEIVQIEGTAPSNRKTSISTKSVPPHILTAATSHPGCAYTDMVVTSRASTNTKTVSTNCTTSLWHVWNGRNLDTLFLSRNRIIPTSPTTRKGANPSFTSNASSTRSSRLPAGSAIRAASRRQFHLQFFSSSMSTTWRVAGLRM